MKVNFDKLRPEERRVILVASDAKYKELCGKVNWKAVAIAGGLVVVTVGLGYVLVKSKGRRGSGLLSAPTKPAVPAAPAAAVVASLAGVSALFGPEAANSTYLEPTWLAMKRLGKWKIGQRLRGAFTKGMIPLPHLAPREAAERFCFDLGGPEDGSAYYLSPCVGNHYLPVAQANERIAQEKLAAYMQIASSLGAKSIEIVSGEVLSTKAKGEANVPLHETAAQIGLNASFATDGKVQRKVLQTFGKPRRAAHVPEAVKPWLDMDPSLRALVNTRLEGEALTTNISLTFGETVDAGADVSAKLEKFDVKVGGTYRRVADTSWSFDVEFWPKES
ncbi:MAG: hypothetical protein RBU45_06080 [Myxococcota bacterium]|jgi:hypothetical protein|nr:hypothetical protein [Myxococcota bacterium]